MLTAEAPDRFRVNFAAVRRPGGWRRMFEPKAVVVVDAFAIGKAVNAAIALCPFKSATGVPQVWNEFRVFLARDDHDRLRPVEASLQKDLGPMLYEELVRLNAVTVGALVVRLLVDDGDEVDPGTGILHARHLPDTQVRTAGIGEITVRLDKLTPPAALPGSPSAAGLGTLPVGACVLRAPAGDVALRSGVRQVLGRAHPDAGADHVALPGAGARINRRQAALRIDGEDIEVSREAGDSNPVSVGGVALAPGQAVTQRLPVEIGLSGGEMKVTVQRA